MESKPLVLFTSFASFVKILKNKSVDILNMYMLLWSWGIYENI